MDGLNGQVQTECNGNANAYSYCGMCPAFVIAAGDTCLEDDNNAAPNIWDHDSLQAAYDFASSNVLGNDYRKYYANQARIGTNDASRMYLGNANDDVFLDHIVPALTGEHGAYFDGNDYMELPKAGEIKFSRDFTAEMYIRFSQEKVDQDWYIFQKTEVFGHDYPFLGVFFAPNNSLCVTFNETLVLEIKDAYLGP